ncbi:hypothetical protein VPNG_00056 [Cytospora leucostoma]|uniref:Uncharacterized protein n=1 Tax=Cytospora leucostoma TaxID=1230097 RepID=A0A423XN86_9PEZI|nr:hypothetical protein VPNG_00056 [Cytospora leucostoma]
MLPPDPSYLAEAVKVFLAQAQRQADQDPIATKLHDREIAALKEAVAVLQGRVAHVDTRTAGYDPAAPGRQEGVVRALRETVAALEGRLARGESCIAKLEEVARAIRARQDGFETAHEAEVARYQEQFSSILDSLAEMESRDAPGPAPAPMPAPAPAPRSVPASVPQARRVAPRYAAEQHPHEDQQDGQRVDEEDDQEEDILVDQPPPPRKETHHPNSNARRKAFEAHFLATRRQYHLKKPGKDQRQFIWSFIEGIQDQELARLTQEYLMDNLHGRAAPVKCKTPKKGRIMALSRDIRWEEVKEALRQMPTPSFLQ